MWRWHTKKYILKFILILLVNQGVETLHSSDVIILINYLKQNKTTPGSRGGVFKFK